MICCVTVFLGYGRKTLRKQILSLDTIWNSEEDYAFYMKFPNYAVFKVLYDYLEVQSGGQLRNWYGSEKNATAILAQ